MTDDPLDPLDDLASAHIDGLASEADERRLAGDPTFQARVATLRGVRDAIRLPDAPIDGERRDRTIAVALAAAEGGGASSIGNARRRRHQRSRRAQLVAVAAAVVLAVLAVPRLVGDDGGSDTIVAAPEAAEPFAEGTASTLSAPAADSALAAGAAPLTAAAPLELGQLADLDELARRLAAAIDAPSDSTTFSAAPDPAEDTAERDACVDASRLRIESGGGTVVLVATAILDGAPAIAVVWTHDDGTRQVDVASLPGCAPLGSRPV